MRRYYENFRRIDAWFQRVDAKAAKIADRLEFWVNAAGLVLLLGAAVYYIERWQRPDFTKGAPNYSNEICVDGR